MRPEHDIQGKFRSEAPACHRCGLPLLDDAHYCPYCERPLDEGAVARLLGRRTPAAQVNSGRRLLGVPQRLVLMAGALVFALAAVISVVLALTS